MTSEVAVAAPMTAAEIMERVVITGDLAKLTPQERVVYYMKTCESLGLNPLTRPFEYIMLDGKLTLYARKDATEQIRRNLFISVDRLEYPTPPTGQYIVVAYGHDRSGRTDSASGVVPIAGLSGMQLSNALMKAETKAKRRFTLSIAGLGMIDETEVSSIPTAVEVEVDASGVIRPPATLAEKVAARAAEVVAPQAVVDHMTNEQVGIVVTGREPEVTTNTIEAPDETYQRTHSPVEAEPEGPRMTLEAFTEAVALAKIDRDDVRKRVKELFPHVTRFSMMTEWELGHAWAIIEQEHAGSKVETQVEPAAVSEPAAVVEEVVLEVMPVEVSAHEVPLCGAPSPYGDDSTCILIRTHTGPHSAGATESW